ncbi:MAG: hypothetical protein A4E55_01091 [Pelotomaculum sp. PtaU1.Bin035]|nr:MAG: hypothetical protein A4E55_01091 [Pelotomaculum sp. PtaU1.Bin035]
MEKTLLFFMQGIPESIGLISFCLALAGVPLRWKIIIAVGMVLTTIVLILRSLPLAYGLHTVAITLLMAFVITKITRIPAAKSLIAAFASICVLAIMELAINNLFFSITKLEQQAVISNNLLWELLGLPQAILMIIFAVIIPKFKKPIEGAWKI